MTRKITEIVIHHTAVSNEKQPDFSKQISSMARTHAQRLNNPWSDWTTIQYHFVVWKDGESKQTRLLEDLWRHATNFSVNQQSIWICMTGNFDEELPHPKQIAKVNEIIQWLFKTYWTLKISFHNEYAPKTCPGKNITKILFTSTTSMNTIDEKAPLTIAIREQMRLSSEIWKLTQSPETKKIMEENNDYFRKNGY